jgi:hypothetical protein
MVISNSDLTDKDRIIATIVGCINSLAGLHCSKNSQQLLKNGVSFLFSCLLPAANYASQIIAEAVKRMYLDPVWGPATTSASSPVSSSIMGITLTAAMQNPALLAGVSPEPVCLDAPVVTSLDPNDKTGSNGIGANRFVTGQQGIPYGIYFDNQPTATAPARAITITDTLNTKH